MVRATIFASLLCGAALAACGGALAPEERAPEGDAGAAVPSFGEAGITQRAPVACQPCAANAACGPQAACVVPTAGGSAAAPYCAPGCSKDGFCPSDRVCTWVSDPDGRPWHACLPVVDPCAVPGERVPVAPRPLRHAGTW
jgi:hypothetical protein